jgi:Trypsin
MPHTHHHRRHHTLHAWALSAAVLAGLTSTASPAHALTNGVSTDSFTALGELGGASGVLISANWVLTAAHVGANVIAGSSSFESATGVSLIDAVYTYSSDLFPGHDLALVHLSTSLDTSAVPLLSDAVVRASQVASLGTLTMASALNGAPQSTATTQAAGVQNTYTSSDGTKLTTNWLLTSGASQVQGGDSGSALFKGQVSDSSQALLIGIASAALTLDSGAKESAYVQVGSYKAWINATMSASGQQALWTSAVPELPALPMMALGLGGIAWLRGRRRG